MSLSAPNDAAPPLLLRREVATEAVGRAVAANGNSSALVKTVPQPHEMLSQ